MAAKVFTEEQRKILSKNPNVESVEKTRIIYTEAFKSYYVKNYLAGKKPTEIFIEAGFDPSILGNKRIERASARWRKLYADGQLIIDTKENISVETKEEKIMNSEPTKKRRGRPRKIVQNVDETPVQKKENIEVIVHTILGLPGENTADILETMEYLNHMDIQGIKLQLLHVLRGTDLAADYEKGLFQTYERDEYISLLINCLEHLRPDMVIHRKSMRSGLRIS